MLVENKSEEDVTDVNDILEEESQKFEKHNLIKVTRHDGKVIEITQYRKDQILRNAQLNV